MKQLKRIAIYVLIPLCFFAIIHLVFAYGNWDINPDNWTEETRGMASVCGVIAVAGGIFLAHEVNN
jgi:hypothetical protein